jgi:hypothetical protein
MKSLKKWWSVSLEAGGVRDALHEVVCCSLRVVGEKRVFRSARADFKQSTSDKVGSLLFEGFVSLRPLLNM